MARDSKSGNHAQGDTRGKSGRGRAKGEYTKAPYVQAHTFKPSLPPERTLTEHLRKSNATNATDSVIPNLIAGSVTNATESVTMSI